MFRDFLKRGRGLLALFLALSIVVVPQAATASRVTPMIVDLQPTGRGAISRIELTNDSDRDIPYEVQMMRGDISPAGELTLTPADEEFVVFPPQSIVEARSQQVFRIQYIGETALDKSQIYYLSVRQVPVAFEEGQNQVQVVINYNILVNVVPNGATPKPVIRSASYIEREIPSPEQEQVAEEGETAERPEPVVQKGIEIDLGNDGNRYFYAGRSNWTITAKTTAGEDFRLTFSGDEMAQLIGVGVVGAGQNRVFFVPTESALDSASLQIDVET